jgi:tetratricopeptide (TPR) repeat protein
VPPPGLATTKMPEALQPRYDKLVREGERNWVLNLNELAIEALAIGERDIAERALSESMLNINNVFGSTVEAQKARLVFFSEDVKLFKGDPHERAMTFLYRGILYMQDGDYENARACFRQGVLQDAFAEEEQDRADWAIFDYLIAHCELELGRPGYAEEAWQRASSSYATFPARYREVVKGGYELLKSMPTINPQDNLLIICQQGRGPEKVRRGNRGQFQSYRRPMNQPGPTRLAVGNDTVDSWMIDSLFFQAKTRGGRAVDRIQKRKVVFKDATGTVGTLGLYSGAVILATANNEGQVVAGLVVLAASGVLIVASELTRTGADIRQWQSLPDSLSVYTGSHAAGTVPLKVYGSGVPLAADVPLAPPGKGLTVVLTLAGAERALLIPAKPTPRRVP